MGRYFIFIIIVAVIFILVDLYAFQAFRATFSNSTVRTKRILAITYWSLSALAIVMVALALLTDLRSWSKVLQTIVMAYLIIMFVTKLFIAIIIMFEDVSRLFRLTYRELFSRPKVSAGLPGAKISRSNFVGKLALLAGAVPFVSMIYGVVRTAYDYKIRRYTLPVVGLPEAFNGLKILQISDIHSGSFLSKQPLVKAVNMINAENADIVLFTGDIVNDRADEMDPYLDVLNKVKAKYLVLSTTGNHDYGDYVTWDTPEAKHENFEKLKAVHGQLGWKLLMNENYIFEKDGQQLAFIGVENWSAHARFHRYGDLPKALKGAESIPHKILLSHDPSHWDAEVTKGGHEDIFLTLAGHTHGFQMGIEIPGFKWSPARLLYKQWAGMYKEGNQSINVNRGLGFIGYPGRVGILPEITVIEFQRA